MTDTPHAPVTESEWMREISELSARYGVEPLVCMLGSVTGDLTAEARGAAVDIARTFVANMTTLGAYPPLRIVGSPSPTT